MTVNNNILLGYDEWSIFNHTQLCSMNTQSLEENPRRAHRLWESLVFGWSPSMGVEAMQTSMMAYVSKLGLSIEISIYQSLELLYYNYSLWIAKSFIAGIS